MLGVTGHTIIECTEEGEPGDEATALTVRLFTEGGMNRTTVEPLNNGHVGWDQEFCPLAIERLSFFSEVTTPRLFVYPIYFCY